MGLSAEHNGREMLGRQENVIKKSPDPWVPHRKHGGGRQKRSYFWEKRYATECGGLAAELV